MNGSFNGFYSLLIIHTIPNKHIITPQVPNVIAK